MRIVIAIACLFMLPGCQSSEPSRPEENSEVAELIKANGWSVTQSNHPTPYDVLKVSGSTAQGRVRVLTADECRILARTRTIRGINLLQADVSDEGLAILASIPQLNLVFLGEKSVGDEGLHALASCKSLKWVVLGGTRNVTGAGIAELAQLPNLTHLSIDSVPLTPRCLKQFVGSKSLASLRITTPIGFDDEAANHLSRMTQLKELSLLLNVVEGKGFSAAGLQSIVDGHVPAKFEFNCPQMLDDDMLRTLVAKGWLYGPAPLGIHKPATAADVEKIDLRGARLTDRGLEAILDCKNVKSLGLGGAALTDATLAKMSNYQKLKSLDLTQTSVSAVGLRAITELPLQSLDLNYVTLDEESMREIGKMTRLERLSLISAKFDPASIKHLHSLSALKQLWVSDTSFTDTAAQHAAELTAITELDVSGSKLSDVGLKHLAKLPNLVRLSIHRTSVSKDACDEVHKEYPELRFYHPHNVK